MNEELNLINNIENKKIENLEQLPCADESKVELLLASQGLKKATDFTFFEFEKVTEEVLKKTEEVFKEFGLFYIKNTRELTEIQRWKEYIIGKNKEEVLLFQKLWNQDDDFGEEAKKKGELLGFPKTAIDAYIKKETISRFDFPEEIKNKDFLAFGNIAFSKDNYKEELKTIEVWAEAIKRMDKDLYLRMVEEYKKDIEFYKNDKV
ncbi:MAG: hypothetical protein WCI93_00860 [bacterium]